MLADKSENIGIHVPFLLLLFPIQSTVFVRYIRQHGYLSIRALEIHTHRGCQARRILLQPNARAVSVPKHPPLPPPLYGLHNDMQSQHAI